MILHRLWGEEGLAYNSWAIQSKPERIDEKAWGRRGVEYSQAARGLHDCLVAQLTSVSTP